MELKTQLSCGDKAWFFNGEHVLQVTVGQVRVEYTASPGCAGWEFVGNTVVNGGENYAPMQEAQKELYMCVETGIGSGSLFTLGESLFLTKEACLEHAKLQIMANEAAKAARQEHEDSMELGAESYLRERLARIEALKASRVK